MVKWNTHRNSSGKSLFSQMDPDGCNLSATRNANSKQKGKHQMRDDAPSVLSRFQQGDVDAFETLFRMHQRAVQGWVMRIVREPSAAEDVTIEAFSRPPAKPRIAAHLAIVYEQPHKVVADALGISVGAVKLRVFRAIRLLR